jgi:hypothetical protein
MFSSFWRLRCFYTARVMTGRRRSASPSTFSLHCALVVAIRGSIMRWIYMAVIWVFAAAVIIFAAQNLEMVAMPFLGFSATQFRHTRQSAASSQLRYELQTGRRSDYLATRSSRKANRNCVGTRLSQTRGASQTSWSAEVKCAAEGIGTVAARIKRAHAPIPGRPRRSQISV